jgi:hypothetical protein
MILERIAMLKRPRFLRGCFAWACALAGFLVCALGWAARAQTPQAPSTSPAGTAPSPASVQGALTLDGPWLFQTGDDARWADPAFDDSNWVAVNLNQPLADQGMEPYTGYAWYRIHLQPEELSHLAALTGGTPLTLLASGNSVGQFAVYVNGVEAGHTRGMTDRPVEYESPPLAVPLPAATSGAAVVLAIRTWADTTIKRGLLVKADLGAL